MEKEREETLPIPWIRFDREEEKIGLARKRIISDYLKVTWSYLKVESGIWIGEEEKKFWEKGGCFLTIEEF